MEYGGAIMVVIPIGTQGRAAKFDSRAYGGTRIVAWSTQSSISNVSMTAHQRRGVRP
jgi:hypothetical protein